MTEVQWVQCEKCSKWRCLPSHVKPESLPDKWYCEEHMESSHCNLDAPEESSTGHSAVTTEAPAAAGAETLDKAKGGMITRYTTTKYTIVRNRFCDSEAVN